MYFAFDTRVLSRSLKPMKRLTYRQCKLIVSDVSVLTIKIYRKLQSHIIVYMTNITLAYYYKKNKLIFNHLFKS